MQYTDLFTYENNIKKIPGVVHPVFYHVCCRYLSQRRHNFLLNVLGGVLSIFYHG